MRTRSGHTLFELAIVLVICSLVVGMAVPAVGHARRVFAVRSAAADLAGLVALTRTAAISAGGAVLVLDLVSGMAHIEAVDGRQLSYTQPLAHKYDVFIESDRATPLRLRYDALGIGRLAAATIRVRRGDVTATLTISSYGRVRQ